MPLSVALSATSISPFSESYCTLLCIDNCMNKSTQVQPEVHLLVQSQVQHFVHLYIDLEVHLHVQFPVYYQVHLKVNH